MYLRRLQSITKTCHRCPLTLTLEITHSEKFHEQHIRIVLCFSSKNVSDEVQNFELESAK